MVGQNVCGKGIVQKKWIKLLISGRNGGSNFLHPPIGGRHRLLYFRTNIKATNMKEIQQGNLLGSVVPLAMFYVGASLNDPIQRCNRII